MRICLHQIEVDAGLEKGRVLEVGYDGRHEGKVLRENSKQFHSN